MPEGGGATLILANAQQCIYSPKGNSSSEKWGRLREEVPPLYEIVTSPTVHNPAIGDFKFDALTSMSVVIRTAFSQDAAVCGASICMNGMILAADGSHASL